MLSKLLSFDSPIAVPTFHLVSDLATVDTILEASVLSDVHLSTKLMTPYSPDSEI